MNQIIYPEKIENNLIEYENNIGSMKKPYKFLFIFSIMCALLFIFYYGFLSFKLYKKNKISRNILNVYDIQKLYSSNTPIALPNVILDSGEATNILGVIEIKKIDLRYPILAKTTDDFLEIAPCKFYGNALNDYGNFCIAGHNYDNGNFFSNLKLLNLGDSIEIYNLNGNYISYIIYDKYETYVSDLSCLNQNTNIREITLITCNNSNKKRLIIKAQQSR